ncbi:MAG: TatD family hydrolase [Alkalispirochaeta sp.]
MATSEAIRFLSDSHFHSTAMEAHGVDPREVLALFRSEFLGPLLDVAIEPEDPPHQRQLSGGVSHVYYSCGLHPSRTDRDDWESAMKQVETEIATGSYHAVGETGLDWYRMYAPRHRQRELFARHLTLARTSALPVIVHNRAADQDVWQMIRDAQVSTMGVMHCFSSDPEWVRPFLDVGMYISFAGNLTFKNAQNLREALKLVPDDRLLLETDAPFLAPHPHRGQPNHPGLLMHTLQCAAELRNTSPAVLGKCVAGNLSRMIRVPLADRP